MATEVGAWGDAEYKRKSDRNLDIRMPGKANSRFHGVRPVHQIISLIKLIRTSRLSLKNTLYLEHAYPVERKRWCAASWCVVHMLGL